MFLLNPSSSSFFLFCHTTNHVTIMLATLSNSAPALTLTTRLAVRSFSCALARYNVQNHTLKDDVANAENNSGSFKTFAEYRKFIVQKDPEALKARFNIMLSNGKAKFCPESQEENSVFGVQTKKIAYNN